MERRLALATAGAVAATLGIATVCAAALGGGTLFGLAGDESAAQIVPGASVEQVTRVVVVRSSDSSVIEPAAALEPAPAPAAVSPAASPTPVVAVVGTAAPSPTTASPPPTTTKVTTTTAKPATPTTEQPATPTTVRRPPGVPADWPADKPIPPMPTGCQDPQLELNGVWNCDD